MVQVEDEFEGEGVAGRRSFLWMISSGMKRRNYAFRYFSLELGPWEAVEELA